MSVVLRYFMVAVILIGGYLLMTYLQQRFDHADLRKAVEAVRFASPGRSAQSIEERLANHCDCLPQDLQWITEIRSKLWGTIVVTTRCPNADDLLSWEVNVSEQYVRPISKSAKSLY
jgi:hypothetical protein